jgi:outer membrane protein OmpA-like peptidoglycan-associated protein
MDETILFDSDQNSIKSGAADKLKQIAASAEKRYSGGQIRIFGYTDSDGSAGLNKELAQQRAEAVQNWLVNNGNISQDRISLSPIGEGNPVASNATEEGKAKNLRVEIAVKKK